jgi:hypothetical protein
MRDFILAALLLFCGCASGLPALRAKLLNGRMTARFRLKPENRPMPVLAYPGGLFVFPARYLIGPYAIGPPHGERRK